MNQTTNFKFLKTFLSLIILTFLTESCIGLRSTGASGKISKHIEEFFVGDNVFQYFIKPIKYKGVNQENASVDATLRNIDKETDSLTVNFTVMLRSSNEINTVIIDNKKNSVDVSHLKTLYIEPSKTEGFFDHRTSMKLSYNQYVNYLLEKEHSIEISNPKEKINIIPSKKAKKAISFIKSRLSLKIR